MIGMVSIILPELHVVLTTENYSSDSRPERGHIVNFRRLLVLLALILISLSLPRTAFAHANLVSSAPAADSLQATPPLELEMTFSEPVDISGVVVTTVDQDGRAVKLDAPRIDPTNDRVVLVSSSDFSIGVSVRSCSRRRITHSPQRPRSISRVGA